MTQFIAYIIVFLLAATPFLEIVGVIPIGVVAGLHAVPVTIIAFIGNMLTIVIVIFLMDKIKVWLEKRKQKKKEKSKKREERAARIWKRYGLPGLAIISPILIGSHLVTILAMGFGGTRKQITVWMTASIFVWAIVTGVASHYGIDFLFSKTGGSGFLDGLIEK